MSLTFEFVFYTQIDFKSYRNLKCGGVRKRSTEHGRKTFSRNSNTSLRSAIGALRFPSRGYKPNVRDSHALLFVHQ